MLNNEIDRLLFDRYGMIVFDIDKLSSVSFSQGRYSQHRNPRGRSTAAVEDTRPMHEGHAMHDAPDGFAERGYLNQCKERFKWPQASDVLCTTAIAMLYDLRDWTYTFPVSRAQSGLMCLHLRIDGNRG